MSVWLILNNLGNSLVFFLFRFNQHSVVAAALRAVGNIVTGDDVQTQVCLLVFSSFMLD